MEENKPPEKEHFFLNALKDSDLVKKSLLGDKEAFGVLIDRHWKVLAIVLYNRLKNHADAEDVLQETFIKAYKKISQLRDPERFSPWIYHIAITTSIDWLRKEKRHKTLSLNEMLEESSLSKDKEKKKSDSSMTDMILKAVQALPEKYHLVVTLRYFKGMSYQEIADHLKEPEGTIGNRLHRANQLLKEWMDLPSKK